MIVGSACRNALLRMGLIMSMLLLSAMAVAQDVDLAKHHHESDNDWVGKAVSSVLPVAGIERIILTRAITSATTDIDLHNIRRMLESGQSLQGRSAGAVLLPPLGANGSGIWEAIIVMRSGEFIRFVADNEWVCLSGTTGEGCFRQKED